MNQDLRRVLRLIQQHDREAYAALSEHYTDGLALAYVAVHRLREEVLATLGLTVGDDIPR